jgi:hypothetical protein
MTRLACCIVAGTVLAGCNPDLKAEKAAWDRYAAQRRITNKKVEECSEKVGLTPAERQLREAEAGCKPYEDALNAISPSGGASERTKWLAAYEAKKASAPCLDEKRLRDVAIEKGHEVLRCASADAEEEQVRKLELLAACQKCALKERCEKNLQHNEIVLGTMLMLEEHPDKKTPQAEKETHAAGEDTPVFACAK